jgi:hypothetical protein
VKWGSSRTLPAPLTSSLTPASWSFAYGTWSITYMSLLPETGCVGAGGMGYMNSKSMLPKSGWWKGERRERERERESAWHVLARGPRLCSSISMELLAHNTHCQWVAHPCHLCRERQHVTAEKEANQAELAVCLSRWDMRPVQGLFQMAPVYGQFICHKGYFSCYKSLSCDREGDTVLALREPRIQWS